MHEIQKNVQIFGLKSIALKHSGVLWLITLTNGELFHYELKFPLNILLGFIRKQKTDKIANQTLTAQFRYSNENTCLAAATISLMIGVFCANNFNDFERCLRMAIIC